MSDHAAQSPVFLLDSHIAPVGGITEEARNDIDGIIHRVIVSVRLKNINIPDFFIYRLVQLA